MTTRRCARTRGSRLLGLVPIVLAAAAFAAGWAPRAAGAPTARPAAARQPVLEGAFTAAQAARGERTFDEVCAGCHDSGEFAGARFRLGWVDRSVGELFDIISTLMPEGDPGSLSPGEYAAVVAYLLQLNGYPAGETPLPANLSALQALEIVEAP